MGAIWTDCSMLHFVRGVLVVFLSAFLLRSLLTFSCYY